MKEWKKKLKAERASKAEQEATKSLEEARKAPISSPLWEGISRGVEASPANRILYTGRQARRAPNEKEADNWGSKAEPTEDVKQFMELTGASEEAAEKAVAEERIYKKVMEEAVRKDRKALPEEDTSK